MHAVIRLLFKCEHCGKCCNISRDISQSDLDTVCAYTHESRQEVEAKLEQQRCGYLVDNLCSIHFAKPSVCKWWPGPGANDCPGYKKLMDKYCSEGAMSKVCHDKELGDLYVKAMLYNDIEAAKTLLRKLNIEE